MLNRFSWKDHNVHRNALGFVWIFHRCRVIHSFLAKWSFPKSFVKRKLSLRLDRSSQWNLHQSELVPRERINRCSSRQPLRLVRSVFFSLATTPSCSSFDEHFSRCEFSRGQWSFSPCSGWYYCLSRITSTRRWWSNGANIDSRRFNEFSRQTSFNDWSSFSSVRTFRRWTFILRSKSSRSNLRGPLSRDDSFDQKVSRFGPFELNVISICSVVEWKLFSFHRYEIFIMIRFIHWSHWRSTTIATEFVRCSSSILLFSSFSLRSENSLQLGTEPISRRWTSMCDQFDGHSLPFEFRRNQFVSDRRCVEMKSRSSGFFSLQKPSHRPNVSISSASISTTLVSDRRFSNGNGRVFL